MTRGVSTTLGFFLGLYLAMIFVSQSAMDIAHTLLLFCALYLVISGQSTGTPIRPLFLPTLNWIFAFWVLLVIAGYAIASEANSPWSHWASRVFEFRWIVTLYLLIWCFFEVAPSAKWLERSGYVFAAFSLYAVVIYIFKFDPVKENPYLGGSAEQRTGGFYSNPMTFAHAYGQTFCWFFGLFIYSSQTRVSNLTRSFGLATALGAAALLVSFTRGMWIGLFFATVIMAYLYRKKWAFYLSSFLIASSASLILIWEPFKDRVFNYFKAGSYDHERLTIWKTNWEIFKEHPWFGVGYGENARRATEFYIHYGYPQETMASHAHNQYLHFLAGTGVFGLLAYIALCVFFVWMSYKVYKKITDDNFVEKGLALGIFGSQIAFHIGSLTESNFEHSKVRAVLVACWSLVVYLAIKHSLVSRVDLTK
jgi:O-antigen ligase